MRKPVLLSMVFVLVAPSLSAQSRPTARHRGTGSYQAEIAVKEAIQELVDEKKAYERDLDVLEHLRIAERALSDSMQPNNAIQKALDEVAKAEQLAVDFTLTQGLIVTRQELERAHLSPAAADFARLRGVLRDSAIGPARRIVARNGTKLTDEQLSWIKVQELITQHLRSLAEIAADSLHAAEQ